MKKRLIYALNIILLVSVVASLLPTDPPFKLRKVLAQYSWYDTLNLYQNITTYQQAIQNITNTYSFAIDVYVYITNVTNQAKISLYKTTANSTTFITIQDGSITKSEDTYTNLQPSEILSFDVSAKPTSTLTISESITVEKRVELIKSEVVIPPPLPPIIHKYPLTVHVIDLFSMNAPDLTVLIKDSTGTIIANLTTHADGKTDPITLAKGTYTVEIYKDNKFQLSQLVHLTEETTLTLQIGIPIIITFTHIAIIALIIIILLIIILYKKKKHG